MRRLLRRSCTVLLSSLLLSACQNKPVSVDLSQSPTPAILSSEQARSQAVPAFESFAETLKAELLGAIEKGGPVVAVEVCSQRAPEIALSVSQERGFLMGRSSHRLRNQDNAPSEAIIAYLAQHAQKPASEASVEVVSSDSDWVVIAPIATQPLCLTCHGDSASFPPELTQTLEKFYPDDKATGFKVGELRGVFWARLPQQENASKLEVTVPGSLPLSEPSSRKIKTH